MNLKLVLFGVSFFLTFQLNAQNYLISFEGNGATTTVSKVRVENLSAGKSLILNGDNILNLIFPSSIRHIWINKSMLKIYPNPVIDNSTLEFTPPVAGKAKISIYDITGKPVAQTESLLERHTQYFTLSGLGRGFYMIIVEGRGFMFSGKALGYGKSAGGIQIEKIVNNLRTEDDIVADSGDKGSYSKVEMDYSPGQTLRFTGYSGDYEAVVTDVPKSNKTITFTFIGIPVVTTSPASATSSSTATGGGIVEADGGAEVTERGVCWSASANPDITLTTKTSDGTGTGSFSSEITGLEPFTDYHIRAYATNSAGTAYGDELTFTTSPTIPSLTTIAATGISRTTATSGGNITSNGGSVVLLSGICWSTSTLPSLSDTHTSDSAEAGIFTSYLSGLSPGTLYYIRAYATNSEGTSYGDELSFTTDPVTTATLSTAEVTSISSTTAVSGGLITDDGGSRVSVRGICWATTPSPTTDDDFTRNGSGTGSFTSDITGLQPSTTYHVRSYATNKEGTAYGNDLSFMTPADFPSLTTTTVSDITRTSAASGGNITSDGGSDITVSGICWGTSHHPSTSGPHTTNGTASGSFTSNMTGLNPETHYYVRAYATNSVGTSYGNELSFTTDQVVRATLSTANVTSIGHESAVSGGEITDDGGSSITARGICWSTSSRPDLNDDFTTDGTGTGSFTSEMSGLQPHTDYHVRAYATNSAGTAYGDDLTFTTSATFPSLNTIPASDITRNSATAGGEITSNGGSRITASGICWSTSHNPAINGSHTSDGSAGGNFSSSITGLTPETLYYIRAYATNGVGTSYGSELSFTTDPVTIATLSTAQITSIGTTTAISGGNITDNGGASVTARGICWSASPSPTIYDNITSNGTGTGSFTSNISGLQLHTTYYVRAWATNSSGTAYGNNVSFTTLADLPSVTTLPATGITRTGATAGGNITSNGGSAVTTSGICWSTSHNPSVSGSHTSDGTATGNFTSSMTGLNPGTLYYIRAYATNSVGTSYGGELSFTTDPVITATLSTAVVTSIGSTSAISGGNITSDGDGAVTARGVCWSTTSYPTLNNNFTSNGTGTGSFTSNITGLQPLTIYHVRAYATNGAGTAYGNDVVFTTNPPQLPVLTTTAVTSVTSSTAVSGGNISDDGGSQVTVRGICWATTSSPTINDNTTSNGTGTGSFTSNMTGLQHSTTYHVRAYATNAAGTAYGNDRTFTTSAVAPSVTTTAASGITRTSATSGGNITSNGGSNVTVSGICWSTSHNPSVNGPHTIDGTANGIFTSNITGLTANTLYYIRAYATNSIGTSYGNELSFTTDPAVIPTLTTSGVSSPGTTTAVSGGNITDDGGAGITARGVCWSTASSPTLSDNFTSNGTGAGSFTSNITGLQPVTTYHVRAYATNNAGTAYGNEVSFTTAQLRPATLTTSAVTSLLSTSAVSGGNITDDGGSSITARGVCWSTNSSPTLGDNYTSNGTGTGSFTSNITGLQPLTDYHVRAYATNGAGTAYGNDLLFTTPGTLASVTTSPVSSSTPTTAVSGGNVTSSGGGFVTSRGVCWGTNSNPTINDNKTTNGSGTGTFTSNLTGLVPNTGYYIRAYATNDSGTAYGEEITFIYVTADIEACKWLKDASCFLSLSFDDSQASHLDVANLLSQYGFKGTFYTETKAFNSHPDLIDLYRDILQQGHEVGSHSVNHVDLTTLNEEDLLYEIDASVSSINSNLNTNCTSLAHPFDAGNSYVNSTIFGRNLFTRNYSEYEPSERPRLSLDSNTELTEVTDFIDAQIAGNGSCMIAGHGLDSSGYSPVTTEFFLELLDYVESVQNNENVWVTTVSNGALYESLFNEVSLSSQVDQSNHEINIQFNFTNRPIYSKFNKLLFSFKIGKNSSWSIQNSSIEYIETDTDYIFTIDLKQANGVTLQYDVNQ